MTDEEFAARQQEILADLPPEFHGALSRLAYEEGHGCGLENVLIHLQDLVGALKLPIAAYRGRVTRECDEARKEVE